MKRGVFLSFILISLLIISGCGSSSNAESNNLDKNPHTKTEFLMGTVVTVKIYDKNKADILKLVFDRINELADKTSSEEMASEITTINENAGVKPVEVSDDVYRLVAVAKEYSHLADGKFDLSVGPLTNLWHIGFPDARKPDQSEIDAMLPFINYKEVRLDEQNQTVYLARKDMALDLGAIAKGFITDEVVTVLKENDVTTAIIDLGGNIFVLGNHPSGDPWTVGIQDPNAARGATIGKVKRSNKSIVTSGVYERYIEVDGERYHHLLNPDTGYPFTNDLAGISIITDSSTDADALSTIAFSKGIEEGIQFIQELTDAEAIFISHDKKVYLTEGLKGMFELTNEQYKMGE
jgi:thiamine biosynthesis lipoprotein